MPAALARFAIARKFEKLSQQREHCEKSHDGHIGELKMKITARLTHFRPTEAGKLQVGTPLFKFVNQMGRMLIT